jgi:hypothetical protein
MNPSIQLILGCFLLSMVVTYAWWSYLRVWFLRQDLFMIRDQLWEAMRTKGTLDLPAHRECRDSINAIIRVAPFLSTLTVFRLFTVEVQHVAPDIQSMPQEVVLARNRVVLRVTRYLLCESLSGLRVALFLITYMSRRVATEWINRMVRGIFDSTEIRTLAKTVTKYRIAS